MKIALVANLDSRSPAAWSGTPAGLAGGLEAHGTEVVHIAPRLGPALKLTAGALSRLVHRNPTVAHRSPEWVALASRSIRRQLAAQRDLDAVIAMNTEAFVLRTELVLATLDDATVAAMRSSPDSDMSRYPAHHTARWARRQAENSRRATRCCVASEWTRTSFVADYGVAAERVHVVGLGRSTRALPPVDRDWSVPRFLFVGLDWRRKNLTGVLSAFAQLRRECPAAQLDVVSDHSGLQAANVRWHGRLALGEPAAQVALGRLFAEATCLVVPSLFEPYGLVYLEAAAAGIPSIGSTEGGWDTAIGDGGLAVDPRDERALVAAMRRLSDPARARELGERARRRAADYSWEAVAGRVLDVLLAARN